MFYQIVDNDFTINYDIKDPDFIQPLLTAVYDELDDHFEGHTPIAFIKWFSANYSRSIGGVEEYKPENMTLYSQKINGIFNQVFTERVETGEFLESYHFLRGLKSKILLPLLKNVGEKFLHDNLELILM